MLGEILKIVADKLNAYIAAELKNPDKPKHVWLVNPTSNTDSLFPKGDGVYMSLLNVEQELSLREGSVNRRVINTAQGAGVQTTQPAVNINLQVIFIANYSNDYTTELSVIYWTMAFFQRKPVFNLANSPELVNCGFSGDDKLLFELNTLPLKDLHYIWGNLGMKQMPSVAYKIKMLTIQDRGELSDGGVINAIELVNKG